MNVADSDETISLLGADSRTVAGAHTVQARRVLTLSNGSP